MEHPELPGARKLEEGILVKTWISTMLTPAPKPFKKTFLLKMPVFVVLGYRAAESCKGMHGHLEGETHEGIRQEPRTQCGALNISAPIGSSYILMIGSQLMELFGKD